MNANRQITGTLRGFDQFMNLVLDGTVDVKNKVDIGMVVSASLGACGCVLVVHFDRREGIILVWTMTEGMFNAAHPLSLSPTCR